MTVITSDQNPHFKLWKKLLVPKGIKQNQQTLVAGEKIIKDLIQSRPELLQALIFPAGWQDENSMFTALQAPEFSLKKELFQQLDLFNTHFPLAAFTTPETHLWPQANEPLESWQLLLACSEPSNLGAILRSALAFNITSVVLLKEACSPYHPKAVRASVGYSFHCNFFRGPSIKELTNILPSEKIFALDLQGEMISKWQPPQKGYLLLGEEGSGVPRELPCQRIVIPMSTRVESLNVAQAATIVFYVLDSCK